MQEKQYSMVLKCVPVELHLLAYLCTAWCKNSGVGFVNLENHCPSMQPANFLLICQNVTLVIFYKPSRYFVSMEGTTIIYLLFYLFIYLNRQALSIKERHSCMCYI